MTAEMLPLINQFFEIESKVRDLDKTASFERNFNRVQHIFKEAGWVIQNPTGEPYQETRTDCEASISGDPKRPMKIAKTLKPIIYQRNQDQLQLVQKAVVLVTNA